MIATPSQAATMGDRSSISRTQWDDSTQCRVVAEIDNFAMKYIDLKSLLMEVVRDTFFAVGSVVITTDDVNPQARFGGTWVKFGEGRTLVGVSPSGTFEAPSKRVGGSETHVLSVEQMPSHTHDQNQHTHNASSGNESAGHTHSVSVSGGAHGHAIAFALNRGGGGNQISGSNNANDSTNSNAIGASTGGHSHTGTTGGINVNHTHTITVDYNTVTNQNTGGGGAHNNLQPWVNVYFWERTA